MEAGKSLDSVKFFVHRMTELDSNVPAGRVLIQFLDSLIPVGGWVRNSLKSLEGSCSAQGQQKQGIHELAATQVGEVGTVGVFGLGAHAEGIEGYGPEMLGIVVFTGDESVQATRQGIDRATSIVCDVIIIGEDNTVFAVQLGGSEMTERLGHEREADQVVGGAMLDDLSLDFHGQVHECEGLLRPRFLARGRGSHDGTLTAMRCDIGVV